MCVTEAGCAWVDYLDVADFSFVGVVLALETWCFLCGVVMARRLAVKPCVWLNPPACSVEVPSVWCLDPFLRLHLFGLMFCNCRPHLCRGFCTRMSCVCISSCVVCVPGGVMTHVQVFCFLFLCLNCTLLPALAAVYAIVSACATRWKSRGWTLERPTRLAPRGGHG